MLREVRARNPSVMTLEGTRTFIVGDRRIAVIDPGPADAGHQDGVASLAGNASTTAILLTHEHPDHAAGAAALAARLGAPVLGLARSSLRDGQAVSTDAGELVVLHTPGHTPDSACFHWPAERAVFCGDLMMGGLDTALVAAPEGDLRLYLASLARVQALEPAVIHPAHGPSFEDAGPAIDRYLRHREDRQTQVLEALGTRSRSEPELVDAVYGDTLPPGLDEVAAGAVRAYLEHLLRLGSVKRDGAVWSRVDA